MLRRDHPPKVPIHAYRLPARVLVVDGDAFVAGADDYMTRPFSTRELLLRTRALLRRIPRTPRAPSA
jgi:DNA-binding response OmpR family regulator